MSFPALSLCGRHWCDLRLPIPLLLLLLVLFTHFLSWLFGQHIFVWNSHVLFGTLSIPCPHPLTGNSGHQSPGQTKISPHISESFCNFGTTLELIMVVSFSFPNCWSVHVMQCNSGWKIWVVWVLLKKAFLPNKNGHMCVCYSVYLPYTLMYKERYVADFLQILQMFFYFLGRRWGI